MTLSLHMLEEAWSKQVISCLSYVTLHVSVEATIKEPSYSGFRHLQRR